jgi:glycosyltransferase involved in cell wall biosynthesis
MNNRKYKICYCTPAIYSAGGVERVVSVKASYFAEVYNYDVTIIVTEGKGRDCFFPLSDKVKVVNLNLGFEELWKVPFIKKVFLYLKKQYKYRRMLRVELLRIQPDITISVLRREINFINSIPDGSHKIGELHVNRSNYRNFTSRDSNFVKRLFARFWMNDLLKHLQKLDRMVVLTEDAKKDWPELSNVTLIPDPIPFKVNQVSTLSSKRVVSIGRYAYEKGNDLLLKAWAKVEKSCKDWSLDIYGMGNQTPYRALMLELGIDETRCHLHGSLTDVKDAYLNSSVFTLPSRFEGFGLVIIEAMACGVPIVAFDCENGPRNIITNNQNGILVPPFNVNEYAESLLRLMRDDQLRAQMGNRAFESSRRYSIEDIALQWKGLFDEVMADNKEQ